MVVAVSSCLYKNLFELWKTTILLIELYEEALVRFVIQILSYIFISNLLNHFIPFLKQVAHRIYIYQIPLV